MAHKRKAEDEGDVDEARKSPKLSYSYPNTAALDAKFRATVQHAHIPPQRSTSISPHSQLDRAAFAPAPFHNLPPLPLILGDTHLQTAPFTHSSVADAKYATAAASHANYERLEFLGDAYIELVATRLIYSRFPHLLTGKQSSVRELLVCNATLARFSRQYGFPARLVAHLERVAATAKTREKVEADVFEAYVAAVVLGDADDGFRRVEAWLTELWAGVLLDKDERDGTLGAPAVQKLAEAGGDGGGGLVAAALAGERKGNFKDQLMALVGGKFVKIEYLEERPMFLKDAVQHHTVGIYLTGWGYSEKRIGGAVGVGKKEAGMLAAKDALTNNTRFVEEVAMRKKEDDDRRRAALDTDRTVAKNDLVNAS